MVEGQASLAEEDRKLPVGTLSGQKFSSQATAILESLYFTGMTGWGKDHEDNITAAIESTGLTLTQIKVYCCVIKRHCILSSFPVLAQMKKNLR